MNILLVSQCTKRALTETRRILDQFAERRGDRTWQTPITQQGLDTLRMLLRKTARKNTAVACHWIRGQNHSELLWVVGDAKQFNANGATPTNMTERNILRQDDENDWHTAHDIRLLAAMAALFHDFGKANDTFQDKLRGQGKLADPYRHEWVSLRLFQAFVGEDADAVWLQRLIDGGNEVNPQWFVNLFSDGVSPGSQAPLEGLSPLAQAIGWLVVSHHRLPTPDLKPKDLVGFKLKRLEKIDLSLEASWCGSRIQASEDDDPKAHQKALMGCWTFNAKLPHHSAAWRKRAATLAQRMLERSSLMDKDNKWFKENPYAMHMARLTLILADHHFSSIEGDRKLGDPTYKAYANTDRNKEGSRLKQRLDEHLIGVEKGAHSIALSLPQLDASLPRIHNHRAFKQRSGSARFAWQDKAFDLATALQVSSEKQGFFGVNMASTGCGKTLANARIMYALAHPQKGARFTVALGLRTLTLQTGDALRERMGLGSDELAVMVGGGAVRALHEHNKQQSAAANATENTLENAGSESAHDLLPSNTHVQYDNTLHPGPLSEYLGGNDPKKQAAQQLLHAPVLVCTVDHLMPACEATRGGHHIVPMLRLLTSDLVLDEPDDFGIEDLYALTRLVHWAGLLGSRVLLSSATLPPALIQGLFAAYLAGRQSFQKNRGQPGLAASVCCAWFDENGAAHSEHADENSYLQSHSALVQKRVAHLAAQHRTDQRRQAHIVPVNIKVTSTPQIRREYAQVILKATLDLHRHPQNHTAEQSAAGQPSGKRVSFGLVRMANIDPLIDVAMALHDMPMPEGVRIHLCVYHSRHPLLVRSGLEHTIDQALQRNGQDKDPAAQLRKPAIRAAIDAHPEADHLFVVLATAVAEVGRDHDYDWAVVEPSSMRSIIQLAGRVRRHRAGAVQEPNIALLSHNLKALENPGGAAFTRPGFETAGHPLAAHALNDLLRDPEWQQLDATSRITQYSPLQAEQRLSDLEHARLGGVMETLAAADQSDDGEDGELTVRRWWQTLSHLTGVEQRSKPFRHDPQGREEFMLLPTEDEDRFEFCTLDDEQRKQNHDNLFAPLALAENPAISAWAVRPYVTELTELAETKSQSLDKLARRFGSLGLPKGEGTQVWAWHPMLGFRRSAQE
ncbi:MAG: type I-F CRISPR-associated helicase Cas3 [Limnohabitans sp.]|uniref:type I-F CRISPR-associated helicase Cas3f n=1 Tax=Limnohabitans sp. TaxID=1907725 RepID=UPI0025CD2533|nr:type I-F CRISPR-associated helicase Cas3f [Limnohabitans sp.]MCO4087838.1 type I-F CRISPR-associated helicase Cas3 [Limnohabitans sp.]